MASWSWRSIWMEIRRHCPIRKMGMCSDTADGVSGALQGEQECIRQACFGGDPLQIDAEMHDRLRDLGPDAADDAVRTHQAQCRHGLQKMLRDERIDRRYPRDGTAP